MKTGSQFRVGDGIKFEIDSIMWSDGASVEVEGGYYEGNVSGSHNTYRVRCENGDWRVISDKMNVLY